MRRPWLRVFRVRVQPPPGWRKRNTGWNLSRQTPAEKTMGFYSGAWALRQVTLLTETKQCVQCGPEPDLCFILAAVSLEQRSHKWRLRRSALFGPQTGVLKYISELFTLWTCHLSGRLDELRKTRVVCAVIQVKEKTTEMNSGALFLPRSFNMLYVVSGKALSDLPAFNFWRICRLISDVVAKTGKGTDLRS